MSKNKFVNILLFIMIIEIFLGGSGKIFNIPIRIGLLLIMLITTLIYIVKYKPEIPKNLIIGIFALWMYCACWVILGVINGNNILHSLNDVTNFFSIIYIVIILVITKSNKKAFKLIISNLKICMLVLSIVTIILFVGSYIGTFFDINIGSMLEWFNNNTNYGIITGALYNFKFARVYFVGGIFMQVSLAFFIYDILNKNRVRDYIYTVIILLGIFSSSTRGYWIGAVIVILMMIIMTNKKQKIRIAKVLLVVSVIFSPIVFTPFFKNEVINRVISVSDFSKDVSNQTRTIQIEYMMDKIKEKPVLGSGFGANLTEYEVETGLSGRQFEVYYLELVYKTGILGMLILLSIFLIPFYFMFKNVIFNENILDEDKELLKALVIGGVSAIITGITNPYMQGTVGIFIIVLMICGYFIVNENTEKINLKNNKWLKENFRKN